MTLLSLLLCDNYFCFVQTFLDNLWLWHSVLHTCSYFACDVASPQPMQWKILQAHSMSNVTMHNMHWENSRLTTNARFQPQFIYSFIKKQKHVVKNQCKDVCVIWHHNYSLVAIKNIIIYVWYYPSVWFR